MLAEKNAEVGKAVTIIKKLSGSERERRLAEMEELARMDEVAGRRSAFNSGLAQGLEKGLEIGLEKAERQRKDMAAAALAKGVSVSDVVEITGLDEETVKRLKTETE
jgi:predicted transposase/invertase (TIGR01784 family)